MRENARNNILDAWILVEQLSEGEFKSGQKGINQLNDIEDCNSTYDFSSLFFKAINDNNKKGGLILYLDIFPFDEVLKLLQEKFGIQPSHEELLKANKFSMALYFRKVIKNDNENEDIKYLEFDEEKFFFTSSGYLRYMLGELRDFPKYENQYKEELGREFSAANSNPNQFNDILMGILQKFSISLSDCYYQVVNNLESSSNNLHSFFINDLEKAKIHKSINLESYLNEYDKNAVRINLDSKSECYNSIFEEILKPINYPLGRFPTNIKYGLSFMQQVAVNLALNDSRNHLRSVNGPPGTGKTTLLKDIFADMIVQQAESICKLKTKKISGRGLRYYENAAIGEVPRDIADNGILVASSNNGAVQNIVNELPLLDGIDNIFIEEINDVDYFTNLANSEVIEEWKNNKRSLDFKLVPGNNKKWGLLSLEGGTATNMSRLLNTIELMTKYFESNDYIEIPDIYEEFQKQQEQVVELREIAERYHEELQEYKKYKVKLSDLKKQSRLILAQIADSLNILNEECHLSKKALQTVLVDLEQFELEYEYAKDSYDGEDKSVMYLFKNKPFFLYFKAQKDHAIKIESAVNKRKEALVNKNIISDKLKQWREKEKILLKKINEIEQSIIDTKYKYENESISYIYKIENIEEMCRKLEVKFKSYSHKPLNMSTDYESLQLSTPWFDEEYRKAQSSLFLVSLKVRKQFLYENKRNVKASLAIWRRQEELIVKNDNAEKLIQEAWNWINMCVPVISTTFASLGRMLKNLPSDSIGNLFIDEAGQALPQACVGGLLRSKNLLAVGDPFQIKPVLTLESKMIACLGKYYNITGKYLSGDASVQTIIDSVSKYGYWKSEDEWIGIPLWVHRRCSYPMFDIANHISYNKNMVQGNNAEGKSYWYDVKGFAKDKYVEEQGEYLARKIDELLKCNPELKNHIYVISPFANVAKKLANKLNAIHFTKYDEGKNKALNVGTVHTFQGKEADIVFFVLGADEKSQGAAKWAITDANIMNVAVTRAKKEFYIIGDKTLYSSFNAPVICKTINIINNYNL